MELKHLIQGKFFLLLNNISKRNRSILYSISDYELSLLIMLMMMILMIINEHVVLIIIMVLNGYG